MLIPILIDALCLVGLYSASFMTNRAARHARGELTEPSVVAQPRARVGGIPNSVLGLLFYALMLPAAWLLAVPAIYVAALVASILAAAFSAYLAFSLLFITRMPCPMCWTGHIVNWSVLALLIAARSGLH